MTTHLIIILLASLLFGWSLRTIIRIHSREQRLYAKQLKVMRMQRIRNTHILVVMMGIIPIIFLPGIWPVVAAAAIHVLVANRLLSRKERDLMREIDAQQDQKAIITLHLGYVFADPERVPLKIWFMPSGVSWPPVEIETGVSYLNLPLENTKGFVLHDHFLPRIASVLKDEDAQSMFLEMKRKLADHGVSHPIDIKGWDYHPGIREMIERIIHAKPQDATHPLPNTNAA